MHKIVKKGSLISSAFLCFCLLGDFFVLAEDLEKRDESGQIASMLAANRSLFVRYQLEYLELSETEAFYSSKSSRRQMTNLQYKMKAMNEDNVRLRSLLPIEKQAREMMKDLLAKKAASSPPPLAVPFTTRKISIEELHEKALVFVERQDYMGALKIYEDIILTFPNDDQAYLLMGYLCILTAQYEKAELAFRNAVDLDPQNLNEIAPFYTNMVLQNPSDDSAYTYLGYAYLILGEFLKARDSFKEALSINPSNGEALKGLHTLERQ